MTNSVVQEVAALTARWAELSAPTDRVTDFTPYVGRPLEYIADVLGVELWEKQADIIRALEQGNRVSVPGCVAAGKDFVSVCYALYWAYVRRGRVILSGATLTQVQNVAMRTARDLWSRAKLPGEQPLKLSLEAPGAGQILARTSTEAGKLSGTHDPAGVLVVISEAQDVTDEAFEGLSSSASGARDKLLAIGNPTKPAGWFARVSREGSGFRTIFVSALDHPNITTGREVIPGGVSQAYIDQTAFDFGETSSVYVARILGRFPESAAQNPLVSTRLLAAARSVPEVGTEVKLGVDVGGGGEDPSVICVKRGNRAIAFKVFRCGVEEVADRVVQVATEYGVRPLQDRREFALPPQEARGEIIIDANGVGAGPAGELKKLGYKVYAFMSQKAPEPGALRRLGVDCVNLRTAAYWNTRQLLMTSGLGLLVDRELDEELLVQSYVETSNGKVGLELKLEIRRRLGRSPNKSDALAYACWDTKIGQISWFGSAGSW